MPEQKFEVFRAKHTKRRGLFISIARRGVITLSQAAYTALGSPHFVELLHVPGTRTIGIRAASEQSRDAYKCNRTIYARQFLMHIGVYPLERPFTVDARMDGDVLVADVSM